MRNQRKFLAGLLVLVLATGFIALSCAGGRAAQGDAPFRSSYDVVIIGSGGAGLSAAAAAREAGADVIVFEKMAIAGGNTNMATGGINATQTVFQERAGITDSPNLFFQDTMRGGYDINNPDLVRVLSRQSGPAVAWLTSIGADLSDVGRLAGASVNRSHRPSGGEMVGPEISMTLQRHVIEVMQIPVITEALVTSITTQCGRANGVVVRYNNRNFTVTANAVILASGGFGANNDMAASYDPSLRGFATTNHPGATGDGIEMAERVGAALVDMEQIQTHPTHAPGREMITEAVRGNGAILTSRSGQRFVDEMATRDVVSAAILAQEGGVAYLVFDDSVRRSLGAIEGYVRRGIVIEGATPEALAAAMGGQGALMIQTITRYNQAVASGNDTEFGRADMPRSLSVAPYYAIEITPAIHHTMGGVKIDTEARVISTTGNPIPGFFAAGEITGGVHGGNRLGGNALADIIVFGRIAGANAAAAAR